MFEAVMERSAWGGGDMGSTPTPRPPQVTAVILIAMCLALVNVATSDAYLLETKFLPAQPET